MKKVMVEQLFQYHKSYSKLHPRQRKNKKKRLAIDKVAILIYIV